MKRCCEAYGYWRTALLEYLCTPGPDGKSPSQLMGRQFKGIMCMFTDSSNCISDSDQLAERRKIEKEKFDKTYGKCDLKQMVIGTTYILICGSQNVEHWEGS